MPSPESQFRPPPLPEPVPVVHVLAREDVLWNRPIFKIPHLEVTPNMFTPMTSPEPAPGPDSGQE